MWSLNLSENDAWPDSNGREARVSAARVHCSLASKMSATTSYSLAVASSMDTSWLFTAPATRSCSETRSLSKSKANQRKHTHTNTRIHEHEHEHTNTHEHTCMNTRGQTKKEHFSCTHLHGHKTSAGACTQGIKLTSQVEESEKRVANWAASARKASRNTSCCSELPATERATARTRAG